MTVVGLGHRGCQLIQTHFDKVTGKLRDHVKYIRVLSPGLVKQLDMTEGLHLIRPRNMRSKFEPDSTAYDDNEERKEVSLPGLGQ